MALYRTKTLRFCCSKERCILKFPKGDYKFASNFEWFIRSLTLSMFLIEWSFTCLDLGMTIYTHDDDEPAMKSEFDNWGLDVVQTFLTLIVMYLLVMYNSFVGKIVKRDDPFSNSNIFVFIIFMVILQKYLLEFIFYPMFGQSQTLIELGVVIRQTVMAIELLFVIIPIRHNFSLNYVES